jgi:hypothetical protein
VRHVRKEAPKLHNCGLTAPFSVEDGMPSPRRHFPDQEGSRCRKAHHELLVSPFRLFQSTLDHDIYIQIMMLALMLQHLLLIFPFRPMFPEPRRHDGRVQVQFAIAQSFLDLLLKVHRSPQGNVSPPALQRRMSPKLLCLGCISANLFHDRNGDAKRSSTSKHHLERSI